jgi:hypothetical protein
MFVLYHCPRMNNMDFSLMSPDGRTTFSQYIDKRYAPWNATSLQQFAAVANGTNPRHYSVCLDHERKPVRVMYFYSCWI